MKSKKKFVLAGFAMLAAITMVLLPLVGCKTEVESNPNPPAPTEKVTVTITPASGGADEGNPLEVTITTVPDGASISYSLDGGEYVEYTGAITVKGPASLKAKATKSGYIDSDEITATYTQRSYKITYKDQGNAEFSGTASNPSEYNMKSAAIILQNASKEGYEFDGWFTDKECTSAAGSPAITAGSHGDKTFYAKWIPYGIGSVEGGPTATVPTLIEDYKIYIYEDEDGSGTLHVSYSGQSTETWYVDGELVKSGERSGYKPDTSTLSIGTHTVMCVVSIYQIGYCSASYELEVVK